MHDINLIVIGVMIGLIAALPVNYLSTTESADQPLAVIRAGTLLSGNHAATGIKATGNVRAGVDLAAMLHTGIKS